MRPRVFEGGPPALFLRAALAALPALAGPACAQSIGNDEGRLVTLQGIRSATVAPHGLGFASLALSGRTENDPEDGIASALALGFGLGDAEETVGFQVSVGMSPVLEDFGASGSLSVKASRRIAAGAAPTYVGLSFDRLAGWGDAEGAEETASLSLTSFPRVMIGGEAYPLMLTLGAGTHQRDGGEEPGLYAGAGIGLTRNFGASLAWTGETVTLGTVFRVEGLDSMRFTASVDDLFDQEDSRRLTVAATFVVEDLFGRP